MREASTMWSTAITATPRRNAGRSRLGERDEDPGQPLLGLHGDDEAVLGRAAVLGRGDVPLVGAGPAGGLQPVRAGDQLSDRGGGSERGFRERRRRRCQRHGGERIPLISAELEQTRTVAAGRV